jgi:hypothetical protein
MVHLQNGGIRYSKKNPEKLKSKGFHESDR